MKVKKYRISLIFLAFLISVSVVCHAQGIKYEAENGTLTGTLQKATILSGYSGTGFVKSFDNTSDTLKVQFSISNNGIYKVYIGYAAPSGDKINNLFIDGSLCEIKFKSTSSFKEIYFSKLGLKPGTHTIGLVKNWGSTYIDYFRIEESFDPETSFVIPNQLVTPNPLNQTRSLYKYLLDNFNKKIHSGVMLKDYNNSIFMEDVEWLKAYTGKYPALIGFDLMNHNRSWTWYDKKQIIREAPKWYRKNGLVTVTWHWRDPLKTTDEFYTSKTNFNVMKISDVNSTEYKAMVTDIDTIAIYLKALQDSLVPVIFRPIHEAAGGWFWWGAKGPEPCKALWKLVFDRLVNYHNIHNLIWVWTSNALDGNMDWYPGNSYVDIVGMDIYQSKKGDKESLALSFNKIKEDFRGKKLITLSENGTVPDPDDLMAKQAGWSWFMPWYAEFVRDGIWNPLAHWQKLMNHEYVVTLDEMPDLKTYSYEGPGLYVDKKITNSKKFNVKLDRSSGILSIIPSDKLAKYTLLVYDLTGRLCYYIPQNISDTTVSIANMNNGIYMVKLISEGIVNNFKIYK